jgi:hypothetical protein
MINTEREARRAAGIIRNTDDPALVEKKLRDHRMAVFQSRQADERRRQERLAEEENLMAEVRWAEEKQ